MSTNALMSDKPKKTKGQKPKDVRARKMVAIREQFHEPASKLGEELGCKDLTELINLILRERLEKHGLWPVRRE